MSRKVSILSQHAQGYMHLSSSVQGKFMESLLSKVSIKPGDTCLDVGCGTGNLTAEIAEKVEAHGQVIGCDPDRRRITNAKRKYFLPNIKFYEGTLSDIELNKAFFNIAVSNLVFHWMDISEQQRTSKKVFSVLKPRGVFALFIEKDNPQNVARILPYTSLETQQRLQQDLFFFTEEQYKERFTSIGFEIVSFELTTFQVPINSVDSYLQLMDATYATKEFSIAYYNNKDKIEICRSADGTFCSKCEVFWVLLRKP